MAKSPAWQRKEGKNPNGGLNAKGRASAKKTGHELETSPAGRRLTPRLFLRKDEWYEEEADLRQDSKRSKQPDQQEPSGLELLR